MAHYRFLTQMRFGAPVPSVRRAIVEPEIWLLRWRDTVAVERTARGGADGLGGCFVATVRAPLGYRLSARVETVAVEGLTWLRMLATGDLVGSGTWRLRPVRPDAPLSVPVMSTPGSGPPCQPTGDRSATDVTFRWDVRTTPPWMHLLSPVARPIFERSHETVMRHAADAAAGGIGTDLLAFRSGPERPRRG